VKDDAGDFVGASSSKIDHVHAALAEAYALGDVVLLARVEILGLFI
jgi:hypothetical protein